MTIGNIAVMIVMLSFIFRTSLGKIISESTETEFVWGDKKIRLKSDDSKRMLDAIFNSMKPLVDAVPIGDRKRILELMIRSTRPLKTTQLFLDGFDREKDKDGKKHQILRDLRDAQLIRPLNSGPWKGDSLVEIKDFGRIMLNQVGSYILGT